VYAALKSYQRDASKGTVGRSNGVMAGIAKQFTLQELKQLAGYIGSLEGDLHTVPESRFADGLHGGSMGSQPRSRAAFTPALCGLCLGALAHAA
jgi:hypothetical protein